MGANAHFYTHGYALWTPGCKHSLILNRTVGKTSLAVSDSRVISSSNSEVNVTREPRELSLSIHSKAVNVSRPARNTDTVRDRIFRDASGSVPGGSAMAGR